MAEPLYDAERGIACLVDDHRAFGLLFHGPDAEDQVWDFIEWIGHDPFQNSEAELDAEIYRWREERLNDRGRLKDSIFLDRRRLRSVAS